MAFFFVKVAYVSTGTTFIVILNCPVHNFIKKPLDLFAGMAFLRNYINVQA